MKRKTLARKLSLRKDTLLGLTEVRGSAGGYCSNSTLSAQVSVCVANTIGPNTRPLPMCGTPIE